MFFFVAFEVFRSLPTSGIFTCGIIERYRDASFAYDRVAFAPLQTWLDACLALPAVKDTLPDPERLVDARANLGVLFLLSLVHKESSRDAVVAAWAHPSPP